MAVSQETPDFRDLVQHKITGVVGKVDACYTKNGVAYLDVIDGYQMHYETPASNWEVVRKHVE